MARPRLFVFAGPNGSGKSTVTGALYGVLKSLPTLYINADEIAAKRGISDYEAAVEAETLRTGALSKRVSFVMETVMSTRSKIDFLKDAKSVGYYVHLEYLTTQDPDINVARVQTRVLAGGHDVPAEKVITRYEKSMALLKEAIEIVDSARIYNNSFENPILIAEKKADQFIAYPQPPPSIWNEERILELVAFVASDSSGSP
jgi:predicted ABC-type ATPase